MMNSLFAGLGLQHKRAPHPDPRQRTDTDVRPGIVHIVDDDAAIRDSLEFLMQSAQLEAHVYPSATTFLSTWRDRRQSCVIADVRMPGMSGIELLTALRKRGDKLPVVLLTGHADIPMAVRAMKAGAHDFLEKPFNDDELLRVLHRALTEPVYALSIERDQIRARFATLTPREHEVMLRIVAGKANKIVSSELGISVRTIEVHRARVMEKLEARSVADLVRMCIATELLPIT